MNEQKIITSNSEQQTEEIAARIGDALCGGEVIELVSDVGGGKTTFVRGLARGIESPDAVASPTFTIARTYESPRYTLQHFDFYRLYDTELIEHELEDCLGETDQIVVVEWADSIQHTLPEKRIRIFIRKTGDTARELKIEAPKKLAYSIEKL